MLTLRLHHLIYALDADTGEALWASDNAGNFSREWTGQFLSDASGNGTLPHFFGSANWPRFTYDEAPVVALTPPEIEVLEHTQEADRHTIRLMITSTRGADHMRFYLEPPAVAQSVAINGDSVRVSVVSADREEL